MKKTIIALLTIGVCLVSCKKTETVTPTGSFTSILVTDATKVSLPDNLLAGESVAVTMPQSAILNALRMTSDEYQKAWANGQIKFGACQKNDQKQIKWESTLGQGRWGHCFGADGAIWSESDPDALICIEGTTSPMNYKVYAVSDIYSHLGETINCTQTIQYSTSLCTTTIYVLWAVKVEKGAPKVVKTGKWGHSLTYDKGANPSLLPIDSSAVASSIGVDPTTAKAYAYVGNALVGEAAETLYFATDGSVSNKDNAAVVVYKNASNEWCWKLTKNESSEGKTVNVSIAFKNDVTNYAYVFATSSIVKERKFARFNGTFSMTTGVVFQAEVLRTDNEREFIFDFPQAAYDTLASMAAKKGQAGVTMALLISRGFMLVKGPMATKEESTATPYGHWFDSSAKVCLESASQVYAGFIINADLTTGHCPITYKNVPGKDKVGEKKSFQQTLYSTALGVTIPVTYIVNIVESLEDE